MPELVGPTADVAERGVEPVGVGRNAAEAIRGALWGVIASGSGVG